MNTPHSPKGPWIHRFTIRFFTVIFAFLVFWALGFLVQDIKSIEGPNYSEIEKQYVDQSLIDQKEQLSNEIKSIERSISNKHDEMRIAQDSSQNLQKTINQLIELQKLTIQKSDSSTDIQQPDISESLTHFLSSQKEYQKYNEELSSLTDKKRTLEAEFISVEEQLSQQKEPAWEEYHRQRKTHRIYLAALQLLILLPLLGIGAFLLAKKRGSIYFPLIFGYGAAILFKVLLIIHEYFPSRYFKYILILGLLYAIVKLLIYFIRMVAYPKAQWLTKQYREAYERFLCPVCEYPIRTGPRKYLFWTRRSVKKMPIPRDGWEERPYTCPSCGTTLMEECPKCHQIRHSLLPNCQHCGEEKQIAE